MKKGKESWGEKAQSLLHSGREGEKIESGSALGVAGGRGPPDHQGGRQGSERGKESNGGRVWIAICRINRAVGEGVSEGVSEGVKEGEEVW